MDYTEKTILIKPDSEICMRLNKYNLKIRIKVTSRAAKLTIEEISRKYITNDNTIRLSLIWTINNEELFFIDINPKNSIDIIKTLSYGIYRRKIKFVLSQNKMINSQTKDVKFFI